MYKYLVGAVVLVASFGQAAEKHIVLTADNTLKMSYVFYDDTIGRVALKAIQLDARLASKEPLYLVLDTPGGSIDAGISLINTLKNLNRSVDTVTIFSASMGFQTVQGLGKRYIIENGTLMSHKARGGFYGEFPGQLDQRYTYYLNRVFNLDKIAANRSGMSLSAYHALIENEYWCEGKKCVKDKFADAIVSVSCDKTLSGKEKVLWGRFYDSMLNKIEIIDVYANCPLIQGIQEWFITVNDEQVTNYSEEIKDEKIREVLKSKIEQASKIKQVIKY